MKCLASGRNFSGAVEMGDKTIEVLSGIKKMMVDMGDGTHAERVVTVAGTASGISSAAPVGNVAITIDSAGVAQALPAYSLAQGGNLRSMPSNSAAGIYVGLAGVTPATGFPLYPGESFPLPIGDTSLWYVVSAATGDTLRLAGA